MRTLIEHDPHDPHDPRDPLAVFAAAVDALNADDWPGVVRLCDPVSLRAFHRTLVDRHAVDDPSHAMTVEHYLETDPEMPRAVAEYQLAQHRRYALRDAALARELVDVPSVEALRALTPEAAFARWLEAHALGTQLVRSLLEAGRSPADAAAARASLAPRPYRVVAIGALADGPHIVHVLYHFRMAPLFVDDAWVDEPSDDEAASFAREMADRPADEQELARVLAETGHPWTTPCRRQPDGSWRLIADSGFLHIDSMAVSIPPDA